MEPGVDATMKTVSTTSSFQVSASLSSRYQGLIDIPMTTQVKSALQNLCTYFDNYAPRVNSLLVVVSVIRVLQLIGPSFMFPDTNSWDQNSVVGQAMGIFSVCFHLVPSQYRADSTIAVLFAFAVVMTLFCIFLFATAFIYKGTAKVSKFGIYVLSIGLNSICFILPPIATEFIGEEISRFANGTVEPGVVSIVAIVYAGVMVIFVTWMMVSIYTFTILFRPMPLASVENIPQNYVIIATLLVTLLTALTSQLGAEFTIPSICVSAIAYFVSLIILFRYGTFITEFNQKLIFMGCLGGGCNILYKLYPYLTGKQYQEEGIVISLAILVVAYIIGELVIRRRISKQLDLFDQFSESHDIDVFSSFSLIRNSIGTGFSYAHPSCLDYEIFKKLAETYHDNPITWILYAKFAAIYPEQSRSLIFISQNITSNHLKGDQIDAALDGIGSTLKNREANLSPELKAKIAKLSKAVTKTKNKLRNVWDLVLQGNVGDMETAIHQAYDSISSTELDLNHLLMTYPNNRFVARQYARFAKEVKADQQLYKTWTDNVHALQRGNQVNPDTVHDLALVAYPNMPQTVDSGASLGINLDADTATEDFLSEEETDQENNEVLTTLIESHKVPAIKFINISATVLFIFCAILPLVLLMALFTWFTGTLQEPLNILYGGSYNRILVNMMPCFELHYLLSHADDIVHPELGTYTEWLEVPDTVPMDSFGGNRDFLGVLKYMLTLTTQTSDLLSPLRSYASGNANMDQARDYIFGSNINYVYRYNTTSNATEQIAAYTTTARMANSLSQIVDLDKIDSSTLMTAASLTPISNYIDTTDALSNGLTLISSYLVENNAMYQTIFTIVIVVLIIVIVIVHVIILIFDFKKLGANKYEIFKSMTNLPKTVISQVSSSFYSIHHANHSTLSNTTTTDEGAEMNKQEENVIKVFTSISDGTSGSATTYIAAAFIGISCILECVGVFLLCDTYMNVSVSLIQSSPHIDYLLGTAAYIDSAFISVEQIMMQVYDQDNDFFVGITDNFTNEIVRLHSLIDQQINYFHQCRFGGSAADEYPYVGMDQFLDYATELLPCHDYSNPVDTFIDQVECFNAEAQIYLMISLFLKFATPIEQETPRYPDPHDGVSEAFYLGPVIIYETFFYPAASSIVTTIGEDLDSQLEPLLIKGIIIIVVCFILLIGVYICSHIEESYLLFTLRLLLHCPSKAIFQSTKLMNVLSGNYGVELEDTTERNTEFFKNVMNKMNDVIIVSNADQDRKVTAVNDTFIKVFGEHEIGEVSIEQFLSDAGLNGDLAEVSKKGGELSWNTKDGVRTFTFTTSSVNNNKLLSGRDITQRLLHKQLIADERKKSDAMLSSILPPNLVPRVQAGEKNISFAVQSVSVLFLDIVSFTPWCGSHDAQYVMKTLNFMFKELDSAVNSHKTLQKVKCIGDCYMAAGGIFDEVNQPAVHAKEMVEFGCEAIHIIERLDEANNEQIRIRVGINTGGPIVAGVLGTEKPTFEILGPTINIAQQMEHHGVPMLVHISRPVYEYIYGGTFSIKERGEVEVKNGNMFTYLVTPQ